MNCVKLALVALCALLPVAPMAAAQSTVRETPLVVVAEPQIFSDMALSSAMYGIISSEVALERSQTPEVRSFAEQMVSEKSEVTTRLIAAAKVDGVAPAAALSPRHLTEIETLRARDAAGFDDAYVTSQMRAHDEAVTLFQGFAEQGQPGALRDVAGEALSRLVQDQAAARQLAEH